MKNKFIILVSLLLCLVQTKMVQAQFSKGQKFVQAGVSLSYENTKTLTPYFTLDSNKYATERTVQNVGISISVLHGEMISNRTLRSAYFALGYTQNNQGSLQIDSLKNGYQRSKNINSNYYVNLGVQYNWYFPITTKFGAYVSESNMLSFAQNNSESRNDSADVLFSLYKTYPSYSVTLQASLGLGLYYWLNKNWLIQTSITPISMGYRFNTNKRDSYSNNGTSSLSSESNNMSNHLLFNSSLNGVNPYGLSIGVVYLLK